MDIPQIDIAGLAALHSAGATVLDVRNPDEYETGHVPGAAFIPLDELADRVGEVPAGVPLYVICAAGGRSQRACEFLAPQGHDVVNVTGGTGAWVDAGHGVVSGPMPG